MSMESKVSFLNELKQNLSETLTMAEMDKVLSAVADQFDRYTLEANECREPSNDDYLEAYLSALEVGGRSGKTVERYRYVITRMLTAVNTPPRCVTVYHLRKYLAMEKERGISDRTLEGTRQIFSAFFNWLQREGMITKNPVANLGAIKCAKKIRDIYTETDLERMKFSCKSLRDRAIITFLASTGCRISEMTGLNRDDVDLDRLECMVLGKGNKERQVYLTPVAGMVLREYLATRDDDSSALFVGKGTARLHPGGVRYMLRKLEARSQVEHIHPHKFRRTRATTMIRHGMPVQEVAAILGHDKLDTTMKYVVLDQSDIKNSFRRYA